MKAVKSKKGFTLIEFNPDDASLWRDPQPGNEDLRKLVTAVWGGVGW
jgi:hypothetical protein